MQNYQKNALEASQFNELLDIDEVQALSADEMPFVEEFKQLLQKHDKLDRFGLTLLHRHFDLADGEVLLERTDVERRMQIIAPTRTESLPGGKAIETTWRFDNEGSLVCIVWCEGLNGHRREHFEISGKNPWDN